MVAGILIRMVARIVAGIVDKFWLSLCHHYSGHLSELTFVRAGNPSHNAENFLT